MTIKDPILAWLVRNCDVADTYSEENEAYFYGTYLGRKIRYGTHQETRVDIGDGDFDRWANSVAVSFTPAVDGFPTQLRRAIFCAMSLKKNCTYINLNDIGFGDDVSIEVFRKSLQQAEAAAD